MKEHLAPAVAAEIDLALLVVEVTRNGEDNPSRLIEVQELVSHLVGATVAAVAIHAAARLVPRLVEMAYLRILPDNALPAPGQWGWLELNAPSMLFFALMLALPIGALAALPAANQWDRTGKLLMQAVLALYALAVCFGIACQVVSIILDAVQATVM